MQLIGGMNKNMEMINIKNAIVPIVLYPWADRPFLANQEIVKRGPHMKKIIENVKCLV